MFIYQDPTHPLHSLLVYKKELCKKPLCILPLHSASRLVRTFLNTHPHTHCRQDVVTKEQLWQ